PAGARELLKAAVQSADGRFDSASALAGTRLAAGWWPRDTFFLRRRAELLLQDNRYDEALQSATLLRQVAPPDEAGAADDLMVRIALDAGQGKALEAAAQRALVINPSDPGPRLLLAEWREKRAREPDRRERALELYRQAVSAAPRDAEAHADLGGLLA